MVNQSVRKAITLLRATAEDRNANVSSLARAAGLPRATALRMIQTLEQEGFLLRIPGDDRVLLGPELLRLARNTDEQLLLREASRPIIGELVARYALSRDEEEEGLSGIATGIRGPGNQLLGVLTVSGPTQRLDRQRRRHAVDHLLRAADQIESVLQRGHEPPAVLEVIGRTSG